MATGNVGAGNQSGLLAGNATSGVQQARQLNQQALQRAGATNFEFSAPLGATTGAGAAGLQAGNAQSGVQQARQLNQHAIQNASNRAGQY